MVVSDVASLVQWEEANLNIWEVKDAIKDEFGWEV